MSNFRPINRDMDFLMPPTVDEWLPQRHLARFVVEVVEGRDLRGYCQVEAKALRSQKLKYPISHVIRIACIGWLIYSY